MTRPPDVVNELKRVSLKERWGLEVVFRVNQDICSLEIAARSVDKDSIGERAGLRDGHLITRVNDWDVEVNTIRYVDIITVEFAGHASS